MPDEKAELIIHMGSREVFFREAKIEDPTPIEFAILVLLARHAMDAVSVEYIVTEVWGREYTNTPDLAKWHVCQLRKKLGDTEREKIHILTVRSYGYRWARSARIIEAQVQA